MTPQPSPAAMAAAEWNAYPGGIPQARKQYRWRLPMAHDPGMFITFIAWMRQRGAGYKDVYSPQFDYWDGYRLHVPDETQWQECEQIEGLQDYGHAEICIEGAELAPCPFCGKIPRWYGSNRSHGGTLIGAAPHQFNTWRLECCAWANTPSGSASWLIAERSKRVNTHALLRSALEAQELLEVLEHEYDHTFPPPDDPRYVQFIGDWNGEDGDTTRWLALEAKSTALRTAALSATKQES